MSDVGKKRCPLGGLFERKEISARATIGYAGQRYPILIDVVGRFQAVENSKQAVSLLILPPDSSGPGQWHNSNAFRLAYSVIASLPEIFSGCRLWPADTAVQDKLNGPLPLRIIVLGNIDHVGKLRSGVIRSRQHVLTKGDLIRVDWPRFKQFKKRSRVWLTQQEFFTQCQSGYFRVCLPETIHESLICRNCIRGFLRTGLRSEQTSQAKRQIPHSD